MSIGFDGIVREERKATPIETVASVPPGTMVTVPTASAKGVSGEHPIVAVDTIHWYKDPTFLLTAGGAFLAVTDPIIEVLSSDQPFHWRPLVLACVLALAAYFRKKLNTVTK